MNSKLNSKINRSEEEEENLDEEGNEQRDEDLIIFFANAVVDSNAMVVKFFNTPKQKKKREI